MLILNYGPEAGFQIISGQMAYMQSLPLRGLLLFTGWTHNLLTFFCWIQATGDEENSIVVLSILTPSLPLDYIPNSEKTSILLATLLNPKPTSVGVRTASCNLTQPSSVLRGSVVLPGLGSEQL